MAVSTPYRYQQAKATPVSGERAAWSTGPRCNTHGRRQGQTAVPWAAGPGRATSGRPTLQTSSNQHDSNRLARTSVTNVVNLSRKISVFGEKALGLTTFVTTRSRTPQNDCNTSSPAEGPWPSCGAHRQQRHHHLPNFARNLSWSFFEMPQKRCNSNDANSMFKQVAGELRAKLMGGGGAWSDHETTRQAKPQQPGPTGVEGAGGTGGHKRARLRCPWAVAGPGRASRRRAERSSRRGRLAGGPPPTGTHSGRALRRPEHLRRPARQRRNTPPRHNKAARPHRGRAAQQVSEAHRRITTMSGSPRPLSWRTLEIPSLAAISFAVPSMRGSS